MPLTAPDISLIIPIRNSVHYFRQTMQSALAQNMRNYEIIVVNDNSLDGSRDIAEELKRMYGRVRIIDLPDNQGPGAARNIALHNAYGEYVVFVEPTDVLEPDLATAVCQAGREHDADIVMFEGRGFTADGASSPLPNPRTPYPAVFRPEDHTATLFEDFAYRLNLMGFRREFLLEAQIMFPSVPHDESLLFTCSALATANLIVRLQDQLYQHRVDAAEPVDPDLSPLDFHESCRLLRAYLEYRGVFERYRQTYANLCGDHIINGLLTAQTSHAFIRAYEFLHIRGVADLGFTGPDAVMPEDEGQARMLRIIVSNDMVSGLYEFWHYDMSLLQQAMANPIAQPVDAQTHRRRLRKKRSKRK